MAGTTMRYLFLRIYSNEELQKFLTEMFEKGWVPDRFKGNFLFFRKQRLKNARLCVASIECTKRTPKGDNQTDEYIEIALRKGWQLLCIGDIESIVPIRRRLYFYTQDPAALPLAPDEIIDSKNAHRAYHLTKRWVFLWTLLTAAALMSTILFMRQDGLHAVLIFLDLALVTIWVSTFPLFFSRRALYLYVTQQVPLPTDSHRTLHRRETLMAGALAVLLLSVILLLFF